MPEATPVECARPTCLNAYIDWHNTQDELAGIDSKSKTHYELATARLLEVINASEFWTELAVQISEYNDSYSMKTGYPLLLTPEFPQLLKKPYSSAVEKVFRINALNNDEFPSPPSGGCIHPGNWLSSVRDIIRTTFVVRYIDGVKYFVDCLTQLCDALGISCRIDFEAKDEGYYAAHFYIRVSTSIPTFDFDTEPADVWVEIQVTTQLQSVIKHLLHHHYEKKRTQSEIDRDAWKWEYESDEFATNYLGHILHYIEGMIADIRTRVHEGECSE